MILRVGIMEREWWPDPDTGLGGALKIPGRYAFALKAIGLFFAWVVGSDVALYDGDEKLVWGPF